MEVLFVTNNVGVIADLGNSETRIGVLLNGKWYEKDIPNTFVALEKRYSLRSEYMNEKTTVFQHEGAYYANGQLVDVEFINRELRPSSLQHKAGQLSTSLSLIMTLYVVHKIVAEVTGTPLADVRLDIEFTVALPPLEHETGEVEMEKTVRDIKELKIFSPNSVTIPMNISKVSVVPEGVSAFFGAFYEEADGQLAEFEKNKMFEQGYVLIVDIGAGTTDVAIIKDTELQLESKDTFKLGGNRVESLLAVSLKKAYKTTPSRQALKEAVQTGYLLLGAKPQDVTETLSAVKRDFAQTLNNQLRQYFERISVDLMEIKGLLLVGGGGLASEYNGIVTTQPMNEYFMEYFKTLAPYCELVNTRGLNLRRLNFEGMKIIHKYSNS